MDAYLLCGGLGTRLRSTASSPKCLAEVAGRPFLELALRHFAAQGVRRFVLCTGFGADAVEARAARVGGCGEIVFSREARRLGTGGALRRALARGRSETLIAANGDSLAAVDLRRLVRFHAVRGADYTLAVAPPAGAEEAGSVDLGPDGRIRAFREKAPGARGHRNAGVYVFSRRFLERVAPAGPFSLERDLFPRAPEHRAFGLVGAGDFVDIGTPARLAGAERRLRELFLLPAAAP